MDFWTQRQNLNTGSALPYQWEMYEKVGTIDNFRIAAGLRQGRRRGYFYTDSDLHKWADAVCRSFTLVQTPVLEETLREYVDLMAAAQSKDGYLYTWNQIAGPGHRWESLLVEHELYCHGHFIEAGVEGAAASMQGVETGRQLLELAMRSADHICRVFEEPRPARTPGHQEIELALMRLYRLTGNDRYEKTATSFLTARGRMLFPGFALARDERAGRAKAASLLPSQNERFDFTETTLNTDPRLLRLRLFFSFLSGRYMQHHRPVSRQRRPTGHAVRWTYMMTAAAMTGAMHAGGDLYRAAERGFARMLNGWTSVSGGIGALPLVEGFGRRWELRDVSAYNETCAAIGSVFLGAELWEQTGDPLYADFLEWQLYNAAAVGIGRQGRSYFYRNPLVSNGNIRRQPWFETACCPSNISRLWAGIHRYVVSGHDGSVCLNQYVTGEFAEERSGVTIEIHSALPWSGDVKTTVLVPDAGSVQLLLRVPSWAVGGSITVDGETTPIAVKHPLRAGLPAFSAAEYHAIRLQPGVHRILLTLKMDPYVIGPYPRVRDQRHRFAVGRGPLLYCLETLSDSTDSKGNTEADPVLAPDSLRYQFETNLIGGLGTVRVRDTRGFERALIPYYAWGNREISKMRVWLLSEQRQDHRHRRR